VLHDFSGKKSTPDNNSAESIHSVHMAV
jgi:hypothetical protein